MPIDSRIEEVQAALDAIAAADSVEDAQYEAAIAALQGQVNDLQAERTTVISDLVASRDALQAILTDLGARITALGG